MRSMRPKTAPHNRQPFTKLFTKLKKEPPGLLQAALEFSEANYFFLTGAALRLSSMAAWAAARRATGTRYGEQLT